jgi:hypothetical protein
MQNAISPLIYFRERLRSTTRQILLFIAVFTGFAVASLRHQEGWSAFDYLIPALLIGIPAGLFVWFLFRLFTFAFRR